MSWFRVDDDMLDHPKWIQALRDGGDAALHLWMRLGTWSSRHLTDGVIPPHVADVLPGPRGGKTRARAYRALADASLIHRQSDGSITLHDYLDFNPSRDSVLAGRQRKTKNKQDQRDRETVTGDNAAPEPGDRSVPSRPVPSPQNSHSTSGRFKGGPDPEPAALMWLPEAYTPPESLYASAILAGCTRAGLDEAVKYWRGRKLGGEWRSAEAFFEGKLGAIRIREEKTRAAARDGARPGPGHGSGSRDPDLDTTGAATAFRPTGDHRKFCEQHKLDIDVAVRAYVAGGEHEQVGFAQSDKRFMARLKCWAHTGVFLATGPLPGAKRKGT